MYRAYRTDSGSGAARFIGAFSNPAWVKQGENGTLISVDKDEATGVVLTGCYSNGADGLYTLNGNDDLLNSLGIVAMIDVGDANADKITEVVFSSFGMLSSDVANTDRIPITDISVRESGYITAANLKNFILSGLDLSGGAKIQTGSYVGTGTYGASNPCSLTFDFSPKLLIIFNDVGRMHYYSGSSSTDHFNQIYDLTALGTDKKYERISSDTDRYSWISSDGKIVCWYCTGSGNRAHQQCNKSGTTYRYMAIG